MKRNHRKNQRPVRPKKYQTPTVVKRPTFFLAMKVSDQSLKDNLQIVQQTLCERIPAIKFGLIPTSKFHITLFVLYIKTNDELKQVMKTLEECSEWLKEKAVCKLNFEGIGNFHYFRVVWAGIRDDRDKNVSEIVSQIHQRMSVRHPDIVEEMKGEWTPHLTLYKSNKDVAQKQKGFQLNAKQICAEDLDGYKETNFGTQQIDGIELLGMEGSPDGYYVLYAKLFCDGKFEIYQETSSKLRI